jgi:hypothetical protein
MLKKIVILLLVMIALFAVVTAFQPSEFRISRQLTIAAPASDLFAQVNDLKNWNSWSSWKELDPNQKVSYEGPTQGVGAIMKLDFKRPFAATHNGEFTFKPEGEKSTQVTWSMYGHNNFIGKAINLVINSDKMVGEQFEKSLANLQATVVKPVVPANNPNDGL